MSSEVNKLPLKKIYSIYTGGFIAFVVFVALLEQLGVSNKILGFLFVGFTLAIYAGIGVISRTMQVSQYYVAGRQVPAFYNGMATAADWMSGASFLAMAGILYTLGYDGLSFVIGWTGGYVLVATLVAPYLRKFGAYTVPDFLSARYGGNVVRALGVFVLIVCSFVYVVAQVRGTGLIAERFLGIDYTIAVFVGLAGILLCSMLGGMRAVTWTQVAQYIVLIIAYMLPVVILSAQREGLPFPQLTYGGVMQDITARESEMISLGLAEAGSLKRYLEPFATYTPLNFFALIFCLMVGTASLPHVLMRYFTTPNVREARKSVGWSLLFIFMLYFTAPAYAAFTKLEVYQNVIGQSLESLPEWVYIYGAAGKVQICDIAAVSVEAIKTACSNAGNGSGILNLSEFSITRDVVVIAAPEIAGLPYVVAGLVGAGGLAAALSTADGLLLAIANALSHDVYFHMIDPKASTRTRLIAARIVLLIVAILAAIVAANPPGGILSLVAWAFSLAAAGNFAVLVLGIWWKRMNTQGAIASMVVGFSLTFYYLAATKYPNIPLIFADDKGLWFGIANLSAGMFGIPVAFLVGIVVSLMTPEPSKEVQDMVEEVRTPKGQTYVDRKQNEAGNDAAS